jgi:hypothetical protein
VNKPPIEVVDVICAAGMDFIFFGSMANRRPSFWSDTFVWYAGILPALHHILLKQYLSH